MESMNKNKVGRQFHSSLDVAAVYIMIYTLGISFACTVLHGVFMFFLWG